MNITDLTAFIEFFDVRPRRRNVKALISIAQKQLEIENISEEHRLLLLRSIEQGQKTILKLARLEKAIRKFLAVFCHDRLQRPDLSDKDREFYLGVHAANVGEYLIEAAEQLEYV